jgi:uncharacterized protein YueI
MPSNPLDMDLTVDADLTLKPSHHLVEFFNQPRTNTDLHLQLNLNPKSQVAYLYVASKTYLHISCCLYCLHFSCLGG